MNKIEVILKPNSKEQKIEKLTDNAYKISVKSPPIKGKANTKMKKVIADYFGIAESEVRIVFGFKSRRKIVVW